MFVSYNLDHSRTLIVQYIKTGPCTSLAISPILWILSSQLKLITFCARSESYFIKDTLKVNYKIIIEFSMSCSTVICFTVEILLYNGC